MKQSTVRIKVVDCKRCHVAFEQPIRRGADQKYCSLCGAKDSELTRHRTRYRDPEAVRRANLKHKYGLSLEQYEKMSKAQNHLCGICGTDDSALQVDHCHTSGKVRGLLCMSCNVLIGQGKDDVNRLYKAIDYLNRYNPQMFSNGEGI